MAVFVQLTDFHLRPPGFLALDRVDADSFAAHAIDAVIAKHPDIDAVIVTGDVADLGEEEAYARAAMLLSRFSVPVLVTPGNHDRTDTMREAFITWPGIAERPVAHKLCHATTHGDVTVVMLDTSVDGMDTGEHHGELGQAQLYWLDETLNAAGPTLIAMHHPPFAIGNAFLDQIALRDADALGAILARYDNVQRVICGHVHRTIVGSIGGVCAMAIPGVAHQMPLLLSDKAKPYMIMEPPTYGVHLVDASGAVSHVGYVEKFAAPPKPVADDKRTGL
ncbi:MAG: phosphodiesterase [Pseudomonadota bacterium]